MTTAVHISLFLLKPLISEEKLQTAESVFTVGQVVNTRILSIDSSHSSSIPRIVASIRQAAPNFVPAPSVEDIPLASIVTESRVVEVQKDNVALTLLPSSARALVSINNLATRRGVTAAKLRSELATGDVLSDSLVVVSRNVEKNFLIVSASAIPSSSKKNIKKDSGEDADLPAIDFSLLKEGDTVEGRITAHSVKHGGLGCTVRISNSVTGTLHPTDSTDDFKKGLSLYPPAIGAVLEFAVLSIDKRSRRLSLSTRPSRVNKSGKEKAKIVDGEVNDIADLKRGQTLRGVVKSVADAGLFVSLGRSVHGRVQIKELFDDVRLFIFELLSTIPISEKLICFRLHICSMSRTGSRDSQWTKL